MEADMHKLVLWGCGNIGRQAYENLSNQYEIIAFGDNDPYKQGLIYKGIPVVGLSDLKEYLEYDIVVSLDKYYEMAQKLSDNNFHVLGYYDFAQRKILPWQQISWEEIRQKSGIRLYAGDIYNNFEKYPDDYIVCLSLTNSNYRCMKHDITHPYPLEDNCIDSYQIEDVLEHIEKENVVSVINEIYRILKTGGYLRLSLPDYNSKFLLHNSFVNSKGDVIFDPLGGGRYIKGKVCFGGHVWFPTYYEVKDILDKSDFTNYKFYRYYDSSGKLYSQTIDYEKGYVSRVKEHCLEQGDISIVVDCFK